MSDFLEPPIEDLSVDDQAVLDHPGNPAGDQLEEPRRESVSGRSDQIVRELIEIVENARSVPMSTSVMINRDEILSLLDEVLTHLPDELRAARWLLKERDEFLAKTRRDGEDIIADAKATSARMVQRTEVARQAKAAARQILEDAEEQARDQKHAAEDYCDQKLASFEAVLDRIGRTVTAGRQRLAATVEQSELGARGPVDEVDDPAAAFFDQDRG